MTYSVNAVANYLIDLGLRDGAKLNVMRLQKLMYYAQGWHLALAHTPLFNEFIEAWEYGPVLSSLYHKFRHLGLEGITQHVVTFDSRNQLRYVESIPNNDTRTLALLDKVYETYRKYTTIQLANMTHVEGDPWDITMRKSGQMLHQQIDLQLMHDYFASMAAA